MKKLLIAVIVIIMGLIVMPSRVSAIVVGDKKISFEEFSLGGELASKEYTLFSYRESNDYFYSRVNGTVSDTFYKVKFDKTYTLLDTEPSDSIFDDYNNCYIEVNGSTKKLEKKCYLPESNTTDTTVIEVDEKYSNLRVDGFDIYNFEKGMGYFVVRASVSQYKFAAGILQNDGNWLIPLSEEVSGFELRPNSYILGKFVDHTKENPEERYADDNIVVEIYNYDKEKLTTINHADLKAKYNAGENDYLELDYLGNVGSVYYFNLVVYYDGSGEEKVYIYGTDNTNFEIDGEYLENVYLYEENGKGILALRYYNGTKRTSILKNLEGETKLDVDDYMLLSYSSEITYLTNFRSNMFIIEKNDIYSLYDYDFNLLYTFAEGLYDIDIDVFPKENGYLANGKYIFETYKEVTGNDEHKYILMNIENADKLALDGTLVDNADKGIKGASVEIHSDVMTATTDDNGYFNFTDIVEGTHNLIVKDAQGATIAAAEVSFVPGAATSVTDNVITYKEGITELTIKVKVDGDNLTIVSVEEGLNNPKPAETGNPKTSDNVLMYILITTMSIVGLAFITINSKKYKLN